MSRRTPSRSSGATPDAGRSIAGAAATHTGRRGFNDPRPVFCQTGADPQLTIGITGSFGKTTTKEMVAAVLATTRQVHATRGNLNNHLGVPLTLLGLTAAHQAAVIELGMSAPGEILALATLARPQIGVLTGVGRAHLAGLGSRAAILHAKLELATALGTEGTLVLPADDQSVLSAARLTGARLLTVSVAQERLPVGVRPDLAAEVIAISPAGVTFRVRGRGLDGLEVALSTPARILEFCSI